MSRYWCSPVLLALCLSAGCLPAQNSRSAGDSSTRGLVLVITPRLNSSGHFPFTGSLVNRNLNADVNVFAEYANWGLFLFKSHDLQERNSLVNYFQPGVFRTIRFDESLSIRLFFGYVFSQRETFRDPDSDYYAAPVVYWIVAPGLKLENCTLFYDLGSGPKLANRLLLNLAVGVFQLDMFLWHRWVFQDQQHATSASLAIVPPRLRLSKSVELSTSFSYQGYITEAKPDFAVRDGFLLSVAFPIHNRR